MISEVDTVVSLPMRREAVLYLGKRQDVLLGQLRLGVGLGEAGPGAKVDVHHEPALVERRQELGLDGLHRDEREAGNDEYRDAGNDRAPVAQRPLEEPAIGALDRALEEASEKALRGFRARRLPGRIGLVARAASPSGLYEHP